VNRARPSQRSSGLEVLAIGHGSLRRLSILRNRTYGYSEYLFTPPQVISNRPRYYRRKKLWLPTVDLTPFPPKRDDLLVATVLDEFSAEVYHPEFRHIALTPFNWQKAIREKPDFVFIESAWRGHRGIWRGHMARKEGPSPQLRTMLRAFREAHIPVVFWNKEDPPNYDYFIETAKEADVVFTTAEELIPTYKTVLGHEKVWLLPFAIQPLIHHPNTSGDFIGEVSFAGTYYAHKHPERKRQIDIVIGGATSFDLDIYPRKASGAQYHWPKEYRKILGPSLPYRQILEVQKRYKVALSVNSVTESPSMCSRRIFELAASGVPIVSGRSQAISRYFGDSVFQSGSKKSTSELIAEVLGGSSTAEHGVESALSCVLTSYTAEKSLNQIALRVFG
jgi:nicotinamidase-related amidase